MSYYPEYFRVVHANDIVPHLPMTEFGFNHAGQEVWYFNAGLDMTFKICENTKGAPESSGCADTLWSYDPYAHMQYVGIDLTLGWCSSDTSSYFLK
jgi:hypothetical protein